MATSKTSTKKKGNAAKPQGFDWPKPAKQVLADYLKARVTADQNAPNEARPFINQKDVLHVHSSDWRAWLAEQGLKPSKADAAKPLRDAGLKVRAFPLPGEGRSLGFYTGTAPAGTSRLPRREAVRRPRASRPFGRLTDEQRQVIGAALTAYEFAPEEAELAEVRDELLEQLG
jgi:hypothetical protein